jgi:hypothetical protein
VPAAGPYLTKSRFLAGLQCEQRLWNAYHDPLPYAEPEPGSPLAVGIEIGRKARALFPGGALVASPPWEHARGVALTRSLMAQPDVPAIFEAAFEFDTIRVRVDVLERLADGAWGLREVKSATSLKPENVQDAALQLHVLRGCGVPVASIEIVHVNRDYERGENGIDWPAFFRHTDVTKETEAVQAAVEATIRRQHAVISWSTAPAVRPSRHCKTPYECEYWSRCTAEKPDDWVFQLPRISAEQLASLEAAGYESIRAIPEDWALNATQARVRDVLVSGEPYVSPDLRKALHGLAPSCFYLDFETMNLAVPLYPGTRPYQQIPFQWSVHRADGHSRLTHHAFLADGRTDPRRELAEALLAILAGSSAPIIAYNAGFEARVLRELAVVLPEFAAALIDIAGRLRDLLPVMRGYVYHPGFRGSFSLKAVAPALVPDLDYSDLLIADGGTASATFARIAAGQLGPDEDEATLRRELLRYCEQDTRAIVELHHTICNLSR